MTVHARKFAADIDLLKNHILNAALQVLASAPGSPVQAQIYFDSNTNAVFYSPDGSAWNQLLSSADLAGTISGSGSSAVAASTAAVVSYVQGLLNGIRWHEAVRAASTANVTVASALINGSTVDGVTLVTGDRVLLKNQTAPAENGVYIVAASGAASRATTEDSSSELLNSAYLVREGTTNGDTGWVISNDTTITVGTTAVTVVQFGSSTTPDASTSTKGKIQIATQAETEAKSDSLKAVVPSDLVNFPKKYSGTFSASTGFTVSAATHALGATKNIAVQLFEDTGTDNYEIEADVNVQDTGDVVIAFSQAMTGSYVLIG